jgi:hypothetical protein
MAIDKNISAFLREGAHTVDISFENNNAANAYTYITDLALEKGDVVLVKGGEELKVGFVNSVHDDLRIEPDSSIRYKWVMGKIDLTYFLENEKKNEEIDELIKTAYRGNMKRSFAQQVLAGLDDDARQRVLSITNGEGK